jgi:hypothetical protein
VLFTVGNTMSTAVIERTVEIGTLRAMGLRRGGIRRLFVCEGLLLGLVGAALGVLIAAAPGGRHQPQRPHLDPARPLAGAADHPRVGRDRADRRDDAGAGARRRAVRLAAGAPRVAAPRGRPR